jgi:hypothetical protein
VGVAVGMKGFSIAPDWTSRSKNRAATSKASTINTR